MSAHIKSDIDAYLAGELPESRRREIDLHVAECEGCRKALHKVRTRLAYNRREALKRASAQPRNLLATPLHREGEGATKNTGGWKGWFVVAFLLVAVTFGWHFFRPQIETVTPAVPPPATPKLPEPRTPPPPTIPIPVQTPVTETILDSTSTTPTSTMRQRPAPAVLPVEVSTPASPVGPAPSSVPGPIHQGPEPAPLNP
jgi:hypothetical protein